MSSNWAPMTKGEAIKGVYNFKNEIVDIRNYLDKMHHKHDNLDPTLMPPG